MTSDTERRNDPSAYEGIPPDASTLKKTLALLERKGIITKVERIALEA